jgi:HAD superfamily hydrolase (TIGR01509 family)
MWVCCVHKKGMAQPVILSDVGKVLIDFDFSIAARRLAQQCDHPAETVLTLFDDIKGPYEIGDMEDAEFVRQGMARTGFRGTAEEFAAIWCEIFAQNEPMHATLGALAGRLPMHLLSNTNELHKSYFLREFAVFQHFQDGVYSHTARCAKPGEEIFRKTLAQLDLDPERTFYIDDLAPNIATAARLGFRTFHYSVAKHSQFQTELDEWLVAQGIG